MSTLRRDWYGSPAVSFTISFIVNYSAHERCRKLRILRGALSIAHNSRGGAHYGEWRTVRGDLLAGTVSIFLTPSSIIQFSMKVTISLSLSLSISFILPLSLGSFMMLRSSDARDIRMGSSGNRQFDRQARIVVGRTPGLNDVSVRVY